MSGRSIQSSLSRWLAIQTLVILSLTCAAVYGMTCWSFAIKQAEEFERYFVLVRHVVKESGEVPELSGVRDKFEDFFTNDLDAAIDVRMGDRPLYASQRKEPGAQGRTRWVTRPIPLADLTPSDLPIQADLALNVGDDDALLSRLGWTLMGATGFGSLMAAFTGSWLVRRGLFPLKKLAAQTAAAGPDRPGRRIQPQGYARELQPWIAQFNALLQRVESAYGQLEAFNADVAHELRTPLSNIIAQGEIELGKSRSTEALRDALGSQIEDARRLSGIVNDMLFLSQADRGAKASRTGSASLAEQVAAVAEFQEAALEEAGLVLQIRGDATLRMDPGLIRRAVSNLVSNAIRHAHAQTTILVDIWRRSGAVKLSVVNQGVPIPAEALPHLFERFYRADSSRTESTNHHGLGLSIVAAIARMHDGTTFAASRGGETRVGLALADRESEDGMGWRG